MGFAHYPANDDAGASRLRAATIAWASLLAELHAVGLRPYLELEHGSAEDALRLYCEMDEGLLLDVSVNDEGLPDVPPATIDGDWVVYIQREEGGYQAEVAIDGKLTFPGLANKLSDLIDAVALGEHPFLESW